MAKNSEKESTLKVKATIRQLSKIANKGINGINKD